MECAGGDSSVSQPAQRGVRRRVALAGDQNESMITQPVPVYDAGGQLLERRPRGCTETQLHY